MMLKMNLPSPALRRIARVVAVLAIAIAAGHLVQTLAARKPARHVENETKTPVKIVQLSAGANEAGLVAPLPAPPVSQLVAPLPVASPVEPLPLTTPVAPLPVVTPPAPACITALDLQQQPGAMIGVALTATCHPNERVVLRHAGMAITARTGADGTLTTALPALASAGKVDVLFTDGSKAETALAMPETVLLRRFGVQWQGPVAFVVHGFQNGADYGEAGDISPLNPGKPAAAAGGFLSLLGDSSVENPLMAQIYTYPMDTTVSSDVVVEAAVTGSTCGHDLLGETLTSARGQSKATELTLAMPDCTAVGDFLVLKNLATDLKIAGN
jgi:hypothetical protein